MKTVQQIVEQLNLALRLDPYTITFLVEQRLSINTALAQSDDCTFTVLEENNKLMLGLLGILNGCSEAHEPLITAMYAANDKKKLIRFTLTPRTMNP